MSSHLISFSFTKRTINLQLKYSYPILTCGCKHTTDCSALEMCCVFVMPWLLKGLQTRETLPSSRSVLVTVYFTRNLERRITVNRKLTVLILFYITKHYTYRNTNSTKCIWPFLQNGWLGLMIANKPQFWLSQFLLCECDCFFLFT